MSELNDNEQNGSEKQYSWLFYTEHLKQAWQDIQSSTDSFDQSLLAVSSGALGVSLAFIKDIVPLKDAVKLDFLVASWLSFASCILVTILSFQLSIAAQKKHLEYLSEYYTNHKEEYLTKTSWYSKVLTACTWLAATALLSGLVCTMIFCVVNICRKPI